LLAERLPQHLRDGMARNRWAIKKPLTFDTSVFDQEAPVHFEFDAFSEHVELQRIGNGDHGERQGLEFRVVADLLDKRPVDLDAVDAEALQVAQARVTGAETVTSSSS